jgi:hypothetical protein
MTCLVCYISPTKIDCWITSLSKDLMVKLLASNPADAAEEVHITKGANAMTTYLKAHFKTLMDRIAQYIA